MDTENIDWSTYEATGSYASFVDAFGKRNASSGTRKQCQYVYKVYLDSSKKMREYKLSRQGK